MDRFDLRQEAQDLVLRGAYREAAPLLDKAAAAYWEAVRTAADPTSDLLSLVFIVSYQVKCAFQEESYERLIRHLSDAAEIRRRLSSPEVVTQSWTQTRTETMDGLSLDAELLVMLRGALPEWDGELSAALVMVESTMAELSALRPDPLSGSFARILERSAKGLEELTETLAGLRVPETVMVTLASASGRLRLFLDRLAMLALPDAVRRWQEQNAGALLSLSRDLEQWRARLGTDLARIAALDEAAPAHSAFVTALYDLDFLPESFAAAEMARARAFADLLAAGRGMAEVLTPDRLREVLLGRSVVEYFLTDDDRLLIFSIRPDGTVMATDRQVDRARLAGEISRLHGSADAPVRSDEDQPEVDALLAGLGALLWDTVPWLPEDGLPVLVVPHLELLRLPFAALVTSTGERVVERHVTSVLPAAAIVADLPAGERGSSESLYALVSPEPMPDPDMPELTRLARGFPRLARAFPGRTDVYYGHDATRDRLAEVAELRPSVLCFATHGVALTGAEEAMDSYLAISGERLTARQIAGQRFPVDVVVLAACETGSGKISADGVVGLSRAFLLAGARSVLMTLWRGTERETLAVLSRFNDHYLRGESPASALRYCHTALIFGDPRDWAGFVLFGSPG